MAIRNKRILITAGPTWVAIDKVRVISNTATGETGILIAERLQKCGAKVTLILGPVDARLINSGIKVIRFKFFGELKRILENELRSRRYDLLIHSAAVSDYKPRSRHSGKIRSGKRQWRCVLVPTPKIIDGLKRIDRSLFLVGFKFAPLAGADQLFREAKRLRKRADLDLVVANSRRKNKYCAYLIGPGRETLRPIRSKSELAGRLIKRLKVLL
ncbi:phosphopantothenoylcysteine decarboxylase [Candidatus Omnitrophota bacterium]